MSEKEILASQRMTEAWGKMSKFGEVKRYLSGIDQNRLRQLRDGETPKEGEENIAGYLQALEEYLNSKNQGVKL